MSDKASVVEQIQTALGVTADGIWGPSTQAALDKFLNPAPANIEHHGMASSFADPKDVLAFNKWFKIFKDKGMSDKDATHAAFKYGDNAEGYFGDSPAEGSGPSCAITPDQMINRWGSVNEAKHKLVNVTANGKTVVCVTKDTLPWEREIVNGVVIDLNPDACSQLGLTPPVMTSCFWTWA